MADIFWKGGADEVAQVTTLTPANVEVGDVFTVKINQKSISFTATATTVANVTAGLQALLDASDEPEFEEITWVDSTTHITATAATPGKPFTLTATSTGDGSPADTFTAATTTASAGPEDVSTAANYSGGALPGAADNLYFDERASHSAKYGLTALAGNTLTSVTVSASFPKTLFIGLPKINKDDAQDPYPEYRADYLKIDASAVNIYGGGGRIKIDSGSVQTALTVNWAGQRLDANTPAILWKGTHTANTANVVRGDVGISFHDTETAHLATLSVGYQTSQFSDSNVICGAGLDIANAAITQTGGGLELRSATGSGTIVLHSGVLTTTGTAAHASLTIHNGGTCYYNGSGTLTLGVVSAGGALDMRQGTAAVTITTLQLYAQSSFYDPQGRGTHTNGIDFMQCEPRELRAFHVVRNRTWTPSAI